MVALLSPPGATHDEWFHAASIWCGHGVEAPQCAEISIEDGRQFALTNMNPFNCQRLAGEVLQCPTQERNQSSSIMNDGLYPSFFYFALSWFVIPSSEMSFATTRIFSAFAVSLIFGLTMYLLPRRYRTVLTLVSLTSFSATGFYLFASINPSSWTSAGVGIGWLSFHAATVSSELSRMRRALLIAIGSTASLMAVGSRYDGYIFVAFVVILILIHALWIRSATRGREILVVAASAGPASLVLLELVSPFSPLEYMRLLYTFNAGEPDNVSFLTHNLLQGLPNALLALGTIPTMSQVVLPQIVFVVGIALLANVMFRTFSPRNILQISGFIFGVLLISLVIAAQVAFNDQRNQGAIEPRYVYPLLIFVVGWWYLLGPADLYRSISSHLRPAAIANTVVFFLTMSTVAERFVDRQTFGVRYLPEGPDQWWWTWLPVGPNVLVVLATCCVWMFFRQLIINENHTDALEV